MGIVYADLRLANHARTDLEEINVTALVDTGALHLCIPDHVAVQLQLAPLKAREVLTADGKSHLVDYVAPVRVSLLGRQCVTGPWCSVIRCRWAPFQWRTWISSSSLHVKRSPSIRRAQISACRWRNRRDRARRRGNRFLVEHAMIEAGGSRRCERYFVAFGRDTGCFGAGTVDPIRGPRAHRKRRGAHPTTRCYPLGAGRGA